MKESIILVAASGLAGEVIAAAEGSATQEIVGLLDDNSELHGTGVSGVEVLGAISNANEYSDMRFVVCVGSGKIAKGFSTS